MCHIYVDITIRDMKVLGDSQDPIAANMKTPSANEIVMEVQNLGPEGGKKNGKSGAPKTLNKTAKD